MVITPEKGLFVAGLIRFNVAVNLILLLMTESLALMVRRPRTVLYSACVMVTVSGCGLTVTDTVAVPLRPEVFVTLRVKVSVAGPCAAVRRGAEKLGVAVVGFVRLTTGPAV